MAKLAAIPQQRAEKQEHTALIFSSLINVAETLVFPLHNIC